MAEDHQLLLAWADGDAQAGNDLIERHFDRLFRFFDSTVPSHAEDLVQDTFRACLEHPERYRGETGFRAYLFGIARRKVLMHWRTHAQWGGAIDISALSLEDLGASPSQRLVHGLNERLLLEGLRRIPIDMQILLLLFYWESLSGAALAHALQIPEGTVRSRLRKAKAELGACMRALADSEDLWRTTLDDLEAWAARVKKIATNP